MDVGCRGARSAVRSPPFLDPPQAVPTSGRLESARTLDRFARLGEPCRRFRRGCCRSAGQGRASAAATTVWPSRTGLRCRSITNRRSDRPFDRSWSTAGRLCGVTTGSESFFSLGQDDVPTARPVKSCARTRSGDRGLVSHPGHHRRSTGAAKRRFALVPVRDGIRPACSRWSHEPPDRQPHWTTEPLPAISYSCYGALRPFPWVSS